MTFAFAAIDFGATSGRVVLGRFDGDSFSMETVGRFPNGPLRREDGLHWDITALYEGALAGLAEAFRLEPNLCSIGVDSWAVDYGLFASGKLLALPFHYRDERTAHGVELVHAVADHSKLYTRNGLQYLSFNSLYQLAVDRESGALDLAENILMIPDLVSYWLTGQMRTERTNASTSGLLSAATSEWDEELMATLGIDPDLWPRLISPGEVIGILRPELMEKLGVKAVPVVAVGSHDTASAVVGVPLTSHSSAYISCGTWGLVGLELEHPVLTDAARDANFTNELGVDGRTRFLHNVMGLWLLTESIRAWNAAGIDVDLQQVLNDAALIEHPVALFDVNDERFMAPGMIPARIAQWCREHSQPVPTSPAEFVRSIIESLAQAFTDAVSTAGGLAEIDIDVIHVVGGGALNQLLCQRIADRSGLTVHAGPVEATAMGNLLVQARAHGVIHGDLSDLRRYLTTIEEPTRYLPHTTTT